MGEIIALGLIETRGFAGLSNATDLMRKAADVEFVQQFYIGGSYAIVIVKGDVMAVRTAVDAGKRELDKLCAPVAAHTITRIDEDILKQLLSKAPAPDTIPEGTAVGVVETVGVAGALEAAKRGLDAAAVTLSAFEGPGGGLMATCFWGDVADVRAAVDAARQSCEPVTRVNGWTVIPSPNPGLAAGFARRPSASFSLKASALGVLETLGFVALFEASDAALDAASVGIGHWKSIGSGYNSIAYCGEVAAVRAALAAAEEVAKARDKFIDSVIIPSPHAATAILLEK